MSMETAKRGVMITRTQFVDAIPLKRELKVEEESLCFRIPLSLTEGINWDDCLESSPTHHISGNANANTYGPYVIFKPSCHLPHTKIITTGTLVQL